MTNKFVSFLKKAGEVIVDAAGIYAGIGAPFTQLLTGKAQTAATTIGGDLEKVASVIVGVEGTFQAVTSAPTGALKLQAAVPQVAGIIMTALGFTKDQVGNVTLWNQGVTEITQGVVDCLNSIKPTAVATSSTSMASPSSTGAVPAPTPAVPAALTPAAPAS